VLAHIGCLENLEECKTALLIEKSRGMNPGKSKNCLDVQAVITGIRRSMIEMLEVTLAHFLENAYKLEHWQLLWETVFLFQ
jgi:hypothetical protein